MRWLKHTISILLLLVAVGVVLATTFSDHSDDYGQVSLPRGGTVHLPEGKVTAFFRVPDSSELGNSSAALTFQVTPSQGGAPLAMTAVDNEASDVAVTRSETIGELGAVAKIDVPAAGDYAVSGSSDLPPGTAYLEFGTNAASAVLARWGLLAGLLLGAALLAIIPVPGRRRDAADEPRWSSDPRAPYAG